jgi:hypothetical protein
MRRAALGIVLCLLVRHLANATPAAPPGQDRNDVPYQVTVSEVSKDSHVIHNRLTFDCQAADGSNGWPPKKIDCVMVQQDLQEPSPPSKDDLDKQLAHMTTDDQVKEFCKGESAKAETQEEVEFRKKVAKACEKADPSAVAPALRAIFREMFDAASQTCSMMTIVRRSTFLYVRKGLWVSYPDPTRACTNVAVTGTLRRDERHPSAWNYTEATVANPSKDSLCHAESGTTQFTWRHAFTASQLKCRYVEM